MNPTDVPEIDVQTLAQKITAGEKFIIVDVRETWEVETVSLPDPRVVVVPLGRISSEGENAFPEAARDRQAEIVVMCHRGVRSAKATAWMKQNGWQNAVSLRGGIAAYAEEIDPSIGVY